jgi:uncharacterized protein with ACT and thioredoxin-like domain
VPSSGIYKKAFLLVWLIISIIMLFSLITPFVLSENTVYKITPKCQWKEKYNRECIMCGLTSAFIHISKGEIAEASRHNRGGIYLFSIFIANLIVLMIFLFVAFRNGINKNKFFV